MAEFLNTKAIPYHVEQLLKSATEYAIVISPYFKLSEHTKQDLEGLGKSQMEVRLVIRGKKLSPTEKAWLDGQPAIRTFLCDNLHAKCYLNEREAIVTSMNFYESRRSNNFEMGIRIARKEDPELYRDVYEEATKLVNISREVGAKAYRTAKAAEAMKVSEKTDSGYCIRCGKDIGLDTKVPYCRDCYREWSKAHDKSQIEQFCHVCGRRTHSTLNKPACYRCYRANPAMFPMAPSK